MAEPVYRKKDRKKGAAEHVYCLKNGKTGWQNLYRGKKIEKGGGGTCILFKRWLNRMAEPVYRRLG